MNYISPRQLAEIWGISSRRIEILAREGRIPGAVMYENRWMIPDDAEKPADRRGRKQKRTAERDRVQKETAITDRHREQKETAAADRHREQKETAAADRHREQKETAAAHPDKGFRFPLFLYYSETDLEKEDFLSEEEQSLYEAQLLYAGCSWEDAYKVFLRLAQTSDQDHILIGAYYYLCLTCMCLKKTASFQMYYQRLEQLVAPHENEIPGLSFILLDIQVLMSGNECFLTQFHPDARLSYPKDIRSYLSVQSAYAAIYQCFTKNSEIPASIFELVCNYYHEQHFLLTELSLHAYLAMIYQLSGNTSRMQTHLKLAVDLAVAKKYYVPLLYCLPYISDPMTEILQSYGQEISEQIIGLSRKYMDTFSYMLNKIRDNTLLSMISQDDFRYISYAFRNLTNKEIAVLEDRSENTISKRYSLIYEKMDVHSKKELKELFYNMMLEY